MKLNYRDNKFALIIIIKINLLRNFSPPALSTSFLRFEGNVLLAHLATPGATVYAGYVAPRTRTATTIPPPHSTATVAKDGMLASVCRQNTICLPDAARLPSPSSVEDNDNSVSPGALCLHKPVLTLGARVRWSVGMS